MPAYVTVCVLNIGLLTTSHFIVEFPISVLSKISV